MADQYISNFTATWNNVLTTFHGVKLNVTDTSSSASSRLFTFQIGATDKIYALKTGALVSASTLTGTGLVLPSAGTINFAASNVVLTHSSGVLTVSTGDLRITTVGEDADSVVTVASLTGSGGSTTAGAIGTYIFAITSYTGNVEYDPGDTVSGANLEPMGLNYNSEIETSAVELTGTWQSMGYSTSNGDDSIHYGSLWVRTV
jgi:hypothetical protein